MKKFIELLKDLTQKGTSIIKKPIMILSNFLMKTKLMKKLRSIKLKHQQTKKIAGFFFVLPWLTGFLLLFIKPLVQSIYFSMLDNELFSVKGGMVKKFVGFENFKYIFRVDTDFNREFFESIQQTLTNLPIIIIFSLFVAILLNQKFHGRGIVRTVFFLPIIFGLDIITGLAETNVVGEVVKGAVENNSFLKATVLQEFLVDSGLPAGFIQVLVSSINQVFSIISFSGVQILIFLSGLQSINPTLYEVCKIEGATNYESFWKVTLPMISPLILTVVVYSFVDSFIRTPITNTIYDTAFKQASFAYSSAMSIVYLLATMVILGIIYWLLSKVVYYND